MSSLIVTGLTKLGAPNGIVTLCLFSLFLLALAFLAYCRFYAKSKRFNELASMIPGPRRYPLIGTAYEFGSDSKEILQNFVKMTKQYKPLSGHWFGPVFYACLYEAEDIEVILSSTTMMDKTIANDMMKSGIGESLISNSGQIWKKHRRYLNPAFYNNVMDKYVEVFFAKTEIMAAVLKPYLESAEVDINPFAQNCIFDILSETMMSTKSNLQNSQATQNYFIEAVISVVDIAHRRFFNPLHYIDFVFDRSTNGKAYKGYFQYIHSFIRQGIARRRKEMQIEEPKSQKRNGNQEGYKFFKKGNMYLDYVLENAEEGDFSDQEILDETCTNMIGGFDSTSFALSMVIFILSKRFDIQEKILEDIVNTFGSLDVKGYSVKQLDSLKYLDRVIKEALRVFSPVPYFARQITEETKLPSGYVLPKGCAAVMVVFCVHRSPDFYPNPDVFDPDHFLPERMAMRPAYSFRPFSGGRRNCIAKRFAVLEVKSAVVSLLRRYWLTPVDVCPNLANKLNLFTTNALKIALAKRTPHRPQIQNYESLSKEILTNIQEYNIKFKQSY